MIEGSVKVLPKTNNGSEILSEKKKCRSACTNGDDCKGNSSGRFGRKSSRFLSPEAYATSFEKSSQRHKLRMKLLSTRNPAEETSAGVQQFFRHVSSYIEKKKLFKSKHPCDTFEKKPTTNSYGSMHPHEKKASPEDLIVIGSSIQYHVYGEVFDEANKTLKEKQKVQEKLTSPKSPKKNDEGNPRGKTSPRPNDHVDKKAREEPSPDSNVFTELQSKKPERRWEIGRKRCKVASPDKITESGERGKGAPAKKKKPSEIPLRKPNEPKPGSRPVKEPPNEMCAVNKPFSPSEDFRVCSESVPGGNVSSNPEGPKHNDDKSPEATNAQFLGSETNNSKQLEMYFDHSSVSTVYSNEFLEENSLGMKQLRIIDLDKLNQTSFTILKTDDIPPKQESPRNQNVSDKKKSTLDKGSIVGSRTKALVKSVKGKSSKKTLFRTSSKGNKPALKVKSKTKKEENPEKKENAKNEKTIHERLDKGKARKTGNVTKSGQPKEVVAFHAPVKLVRTRAKSFLRGIEVSKDRERQRKWRSTTTSMEQIHFVNLEKTEEPKQPEDNQPKQTTEENKCEGMGDSTNKEIASIALPPIPDVFPTPTNLAEAAATRGEARSNCKAAIAPGEKLRKSDLDWSDVEPGARNKSPEAATQRKGVRQDPHDGVEASQVKAPDSVGLEKGGAPASEDFPKVIKGVKIELKTLEDILKGQATFDGADFAEAYEWAFMSTKIDESPCDMAETCSSEFRTIPEESIKKPQETSADSLLSELAEEPGPLNMSIQKPQRSCSSLKSRHGEENRLYNASEGGMKTSRKKKIRSDAASRRFPSPPPNGFFNSEITLLSKVAPGTRQRSGLTKANGRDEKKEVFEDLPVIKLKRRNSEPHSLRGYIWKCADAANTRGHKPSVSSMASSLRHLNTDDADDFIFWEAVPQRRTAWEASLYHFKRPWSVLSCSVFKDNRRSNTPGLILENLRNGGGLRRFSASENEWLRCRKDNLFDVEPSIAQKNIDIRNWLAALNFPMIPSTSSDFLGESNFGSQSTSEPQNRNKSQTSPTRRKLVPNLNFSEEPSEKRGEDRDKFRNTNKWSGSDSESLTELTRRKSGGFVTAEQFKNFEHPYRRPVAAVNLCLYSKSVEESPLIEGNDGCPGEEPRKLKSVEASTSSTVVDEISARGDQGVERKPSEVENEKEAISSCFLKDKFKRLASCLNMCKYFFVFTIVFAVVHFFFLHG